MSKKQVEEPKKPDIFLSTRNLEAFPNISNLKQICQSLATISIYYDEYGFLHYRSISENSWQCYFYINSGDTFFCIFFNIYGSIVIGFDFDTEIWSKIVENNLRSYPGLIDKVPEEFSSILEKFTYLMPFYKDGLDLNCGSHFGSSDLKDTYRITYCIWRKYTDSKWNIGNIDFNKIIEISEYSYLELDQDEQDIIDGSKQSLCILDGKPETFFWWYSENLDIESVKYIYEHKPLTEEIFPKLKDPEVRKKIEEIGYPIA